MSINEEEGCIFMPLRTVVYAITAIGILNKLPGFYGLIFLEHQNTTTTIYYLYSIVGFVIFSLGLYGINKDNRSLLKFYVIFYWIDLLVGTLTIAYLSIQTFGHQDYSRINLLDDPQKMAKYEKISESSRNTSIVLLVFIKIAQVYFACIVTQYYKSINKTKYSRITQQTDEEQDFTRAIESM